MAGKFPVNEREGVLEDLYRNDILLYIGMIRFIDQAYYESRGACRRASANPLWQGYILNVKAGFVILLHTYYRTLSRTVSVV